MRRSWMTYLQQRQTIFNKIMMMMMMMNPTRHEDRHQLSLLKLISVMMTVGSFVVFLNVTSAIVITTATAAFTLERGSSRCSTRIRTIIRTISPEHSRSSSSSSSFRFYSTTDDSASSYGGGLVRQGGADGDGTKRQLLNAFTNLGTADQYDAVLTGLCAKILDGTATSPQQNDASTTSTMMVAIQDCTDLLEEMNTSKITASSRSLMALIDATTKTQSASCMARVIRLCIRNSFGGAVGSRQQPQASGGVQQYGQQLRDIRILSMVRGSDYKSIYNQKVTCPDGSKKTVQERLASYEDIPTDDERVKEVTSAALFGTTVVTSEIINLSTSSDSIEHFISSTILTLLISITIIDNGYDFINMASKWAMSQMKIEKKDQFQLPDKNALPLNLGQGIITGGIVRGFTRLFTIDPIRDAQCEAAALYAAYVLGLPCFPYRPNAFEASVLVAESGTNDNNDSARRTTNTSNSDDAMDNLLTSSSGILRILMWLYAPVVMEYMNHPQLIISDPREAKGCLQRIEEYYGATDPRLFWLNDNDDNNRNGMDNNKTNKDNLLKWAYMEADVLIRSNKQIVMELSDRLASGAATIGDCVAVIEGWE